MVARQGYRFNRLILMATLGLDRWPAKTEPGLRSSGTLKPLKARGFKVAASSKLFASHFNNCLEGFRLFDSDFS